MGKADHLQQPDLSLSKDDNQVPHYTPSIPASYASLIVYKSDHLRLFAFPHDVSQAVYETIQTHWPRGIQEQKDHQGAHDIKLKGYPFGADTDDVIHAGRLIRQILTTLFAHGWIATLPTCVNKDLSIKETLIFRRQTNPPLHDRTDWMTLLFYKNDRLLIMDATSELLGQMKEDIALVTASHQPHKLEGVYKFKFDGTPWASYSSNSLSWKITLKLIESLETHGFHVYASVSQKGGIGSKDTSTWHCCRKTAWVPGAPVYDA